LANYINGLERTTQTIKVVTLHREVIEQFLFASLCFSVFFQTCSQHVGFYNHSRRESGVVLTQGSKADYPMLGVVTRFQPAGPLQQPLQAPAPKDAEPEDFQAHTVAEV
jgi:hypothetical protein